MFAYELPIDPPCDGWKEYKLPMLCSDRIEDICKDILARGGRTIYSGVYDAIYELVEAEIEYENIN
jgi:hypothetical protein